MKHTYKVHQAMARREGHEKGTIPDPEEDDANDLGPVDDRTQVESLPGHLFDLAHAQEVDCLKVQVDARNKHDGQERVLLVRHNHLFNPAKPDLLEDCHCKIDVLIKKNFSFFLVVGAPHVPRCVIAKTGRCIMSGSRSNSLGTMWCWLCVYFHHAAEMPLP